MMGMTMQCMPMMLKFKLSLITEDSATNNLFVKTQERLEEDDGIYREAIERLAIKGKKKLDRYNSLMDFIFCETFTSWQRKCFKYYNDQGPLLKEDKDMDEKSIRFYDKYMSQYVLEVAKVLHDKKQWCWWYQFQNLVLDTAERVKQAVEAKRTNTQ